MLLNPVLQAIEDAQSAFEQNPNSKWIIGFSGGKDSSAMLKILLAAAMKASTRPTEISIIYCDTGVENPVLDDYVKELFFRLEAEINASNLPFKTHFLRAPISERFFVKVIGRGYPTPTNIFRWCTDKLRVKPVTRFIEKSASQDAIVCLGVRKLESQQRDRTLERYGNEKWQLKGKQGYSYRMYLPILDFSVEDVWDIVFMQGKPYSLNANALEKIYRGAAGECPIIKEPNAAACGTGRFGCWTCTVVRKDKSMAALIEDGHISLLPYLEFRNWIAQVRNDPKRRWKKRRNGTDGMGPFTLVARKEILNRLDELSITVGKNLLLPEERQEIFKLWDLDRGIERI